MVMVTQKKNDQATYYGLSESSGDIGGEDYGLLDVANKDEEDYITPK